MPTSDTWLTSYSSTSFSKMRLFCFHYAGGNAQIFHPWLPLLPAGLELIAINLPGRGILFDKPPYTDLNKLTSHLIKKLTPWLNKPYAIFGHSLGAILAFEVTRCIRRFNYPLPKHLFLAGREGPHIADEQQNYLLPDEKFFQVLREKEGTPEAILENKDLMKLLLPAIRADFELAETYQCQQEPPLSCPITVLGGLQEETTEEEFATWEKETTGEFKLNFLPGNHFFIHTQYEAIIDMISKVFYSRNG